MRLIVLTVPVEAVELASDQLWSAGAQAIEERTAGGGVVELHTTLAADDEVSSSRLGNIPAAWSVEFVDATDAPEESWRRFAIPIRVSDRLVLHPAWVEAAVGPDELAIGIEPGGSFGLGDHPTTQLSAQALEHLVEPGDRVLDVGCGSGVLSILAARRGASAVVAIDIAETAVEATMSNAIRNGVETAIDVSARALADVEGEFDIVVANILAPALVAMAGDLCRSTKSNGRLVVSGVLTGQFDHVVEALEPMIVVDEFGLDGWSAVVLAHRSEAASSSRIAPASG